MKPSILLTEPDKDFSETMQKALMAKSFSVEAVNTGKDCQIKAYQGNFSFLVLNYEIQNYSVTEVLKYFKSKSSSLKIILSVAHMLEGKINKDSLKKLGVAKIIHYPYTEVELEECIARMSQTEGLISESAPLEDQIKSGKELTIKYVQQLYTQGLNVGSIEYGNKLGDAIHQIVRRHDDFHKLLQEWDDYDPPVGTHSFMVIFFSMLICKSLTWDTPRSIQAIALAALLHDIGMTRLPKEMWETIPGENDPGIEKYKMHPTWGLEMLQELNIVPEPVIQIVYQHHESSDGRGFPNKLTDKKIYPLAKVVILADSFARTLLEHKVTPFLALQKFVTNRENIQKLDPNLVKTLIKCFMKPDRKDI